MICRTICATMLCDAIHAFDGRTDDLKAAARGFGAAEVGALSDYLDSSVVAHRVAASWIARAVIERGRGDLLDLPSFFGRLKGETDWQVLLHILQSVQFAPNAAVTHSGRIEELVNHPKTLVAVWALDAKVRIALVSGKGMVEARSLVETALSHPKASCRARARHLAPLPGL